MITSCDDAAVPMATLAILPLVMLEEAVTGPSRKRSKFKRSAAVERLANRKCNPGLKVEWHGGPGSGGPCITYRKEASGLFSRNYN